MPQYGIRMEIFAVLRTEKKDMSVIKCQTVVVLLFTITRRELRRPWAI